MSVPEISGDESEQQPPHRGHWRRPRDYLVAVLLLVAALLGWWLIFLGSDIRATTSATAPVAQTELTAPATVPARLRQIWQASSPQTPAPVATPPSVVTGDNHTVTGRDPLTGAARWRYTRSNLSLCEVSSGWSKVLALYRRNGYCSEVTSLDANTGKRGAQRNGDAAGNTRLVDGGTYVTTTGKTLLDTWRSDLVQTMEYGAVEDFNQPGKQPRQGCTYGSVAARADLVGVIERCPADEDRKQQPGDRVTVYQAAPPSADTPVVTFSLVLPGKHARIVAVNDDYTAVALPGSLLVYANHTKKLAAKYPITVPAKDFRGDPPGRVVPTASGSDALYWFTGSNTMALSANDFHPLFSVAHTLGSGTEFAGGLLLPVQGAIEVLDPRSGVQRSRIVVHRGGYSGHIAMASIGPVVLEQRGATLVALR
ncbi:MAG: Rv3212 family protein [Sciscionella sp.]